MELLGGLHPPPPELLVGPVHLVVREGMSDHPVEQTLPALRILVEQFVSL